MTKFLKLWLLRSGIEWNPGPKRKTNRCPKCAKCNQFVASSGVCNTCDYQPIVQVFEAQPDSAQPLSTQVPLADTQVDSLTQQAASMALFQHINSAFNINAAGIQNLLEAGYIFGYFDSPRPPLFSHTETNLLKYQIAELQNVHGDGACLFNVFSLLLFGNETAATNIRRKICEVMPTINFPAGTLYANGSVCTTVEEYLKSSSMRYRYAYGGDAEVATFCSLTKLSVVVYVATINGWVVYCDPHSEQPPETGPHVFLYLEGNHFQLVTRMDYTGVAFEHDDNIPKSSHRPKTTSTTTSLSCSSSAINKTFPCPHPFTPAAANETCHQPLASNSAPGNSLNYSK